MKSNKIILIAIFLLAIVMVGAVSATEDSLDNTTSSTASDILTDDDDDDGGFEEYTEGSGSEDANLEVEWPSEIKVGEFTPIKFKLPGDINSESRIVLFVNNERVDDGIYARGNLPYYVFIDDYGTYNLKFKFYGDSKYAPTTSEKTYVVNDYRFNVERQSGGDVIYGEECTISVDLPFDATGIVTIGDFKYQVEDYTSFTASLKNLKIGTNEISVIYSGDERYPSKTVKVYINVKPDVIYSSLMPFNNASFVLNLPSDAKGKFEVVVDGNINKTSGFTDGVAKITFDGLAFGGHRFKASYTGSDYDYAQTEEMHFEVVPEIVVNSFKTNNDDNAVNINIPKGESGNFAVTLRRFLEEGGQVVSETSKSLNITASSSVSFSKLYSGYYIYDISFTSASGYFYRTSAEGYVREIYSMNVTAPSWVLADTDNITINVTFLPVDIGSISLFVDGEYYDELDIEYINQATFSIDDGLSVGDHKIKVRFSGNSKYLPLEKEFTMTSDYAVLNIPDEIVIGSDDVISINTVEDATGQLFVYVDGAEFGKAYIKNGYAGINMSSLQFKSYTITATYKNGNYPQMSKSKVLKVSYTFKMSNETLAYGQENLYAINVPSGLSTDKLVVKVDNVQYNPIVTKTGVYVDLSSLTIGPHIISVTHPGEGSYYPLSIQNTISVAGKITLPSKVTFASETLVSLVLPKNPQGRLVISEYDENYNYYAPIASVGFADYGDNSIAEYDLSYLSIGQHSIRASYSGDDFNVTGDTKDIAVDLNLNYNRAVQYGKKATITIRLDDAQGSVDVYLDGDYCDVVDFENGIAQIVFEDLEVGQHYFELQYDDYYSFDYEGILGIYPIMSVPTTVTDSSSSILIDSGFEPTGTVMVYVDGKKFREIDLDEDEQRISLSSLVNGNHEISLVYDSWDEFKYEKTYGVVVKKSTITAKGMSMLYLDGSKFKVQIKKYNGKTVGKGQTVKFYVDGKIFKTVKTDANGYAYVVLTHTPGTHTVKVVYKSSYVSKKVTVKQVLSLKKVTVKKSAKSLVLTATLKKVKGKYLKNKLVSFKFNGKTIKAYTNSKGIAKATLQSSVLKKLKVGKSLTYKATYVKATVKQTVTVKK